MTTALQGAELDVLPDDSEFVLSHLNHPTDGPPTLLGRTAATPPPALQGGLEASVVSSEDMYRTFAVDRTTKPTVEVVLSQAHLADRAAIQQLIDRITREVEDWNLEHRLRMPAGDRDAYAAAAAMAAQPRPALSGARRALERSIDAGRRTDLAAWPPAARGALVAEVEHVQRVGELLPSFDDYLRRIILPRGQSSRAPL